jgi:hypothetical protein
MKKSIVVLIFLGFLLSCNKKTDPISSSIVGTWKLIEVLADPGDGSGTFQPVNSTKTIIFDANGNVSSNGSMCDMSTGANTGSTGTYSDAQATFNSIECQNLTINYELNNTTLILIYPCIEPCKAKYIKVE